VIAQLREVTFGGAASAASGDAAQAALSLKHCNRLDFGRAACKAFCLVGGAFCIAFVVFWAVTTQARQEIQIWHGLTQRHMGVRGRTVT
jgi:hypothetical protein